MPPNQPAHLTHAIPTNSHLSLTPNLSDLPDSQYTAALSGLKITYPSSPSTLPPSAPNDMESTDQHLIVGPTPTNPLLCITRVFFVSCLVLLLLVSTYTADACHEVRHVKSVHQHKGYSGPDFFWGGSESRERNGFLSS